MFHISSYTALLSLLLFLSFLSSLLSTATGVSASSSDSDFRDTCQSASRFYAIFLNPKQLQLSLLRRDDPQVSGVKESTNQSLAESRGDFVRFGTLEDRSRSPASSSSPAARSALGTLDFRTVDDFEDGAEGDLEDGCRVQASVPPGVVAGAISFRSMAVIAGVRSANEDGEERDGGVLLKLLVEDFIPQFSDSRLTLTLSRSTDPKLSLDFKDTEAKFVGATGEKKTAEVSHDEDDQQVTLVFDVPAGFSQGEKLQLELVLAEAKITPGFSLAVLLGVGIALCVVFIVLSIVVRVLMGRQAKQKEGVFAGKAVAAAGQK